MTAAVADACVVTVPLTPAVRHAAASVAARAGLEIADLVRMFLTRVATDDRLPYDPFASADYGDEEPNEETLEAIREAESGNYRVYDSLEEMMQDMEREEARGERGRFWNRFGRRDRADDGYRQESWQEHVGNGPDYGQQDGWQNAQGGADYNNYNRAVRTATETVTTTVITMPKKAVTVIRPTTAMKATATATTTVITMHGRGAAKAASAWSSRRSSAASSPHRSRSRSLSY